MARPGLEPGTPRFSVVTSKRPAGANSLETTQFQQNRCSAPMFGICGLFPAILGLTDTSGPKRPHVPIGYDGNPRRASPPDVGERGETGVGIAFGARSSGAMPAGLAWPACVSLRELRGHLRVRWYATPGNVCIQGAREQASHAGSARSVAEAGKHPARIYAPAHRPEQASQPSEPRRSLIARRRSWHVERTRCASRDTRRAVSIPVANRRASATGSGGTSTSTTSACATEDLVALPAVR
jgi:hypothetical protein